MDTIVCVKRVPQTAEADVKLDSSGKDILRDRLAFDINESDNYAIEEAILLKEKFGGTVTLISVGSRECEEVLRMGIAKGADSAIRVTDDKFNKLDGFATAQILSSVVNGLHYDLIFTGCISSDNGYSHVGPALAELLKIPHATLVSNIELVNDISRARVQRELEGGLLEVLDIRLPALITLQTGINEPRYASLISIRRAAAKEIKVVSSKDIGIESLRLKTELETLFSPPIEKRAEILEGSSEETSAKLAGILKEKGLM